MHSLTRQCYIQFPIMLQLYEFTSVCIIYTMWLKLSFSKELHGVFLICVCIAYKGFIPHAPMHMYTTITIIINSSIAVRTYSHAVHVTIILQSTHARACCMSRSGYAYLCPTIDTPDLYYISPTSISASTCII